MSNGIYRVTDEYWKILRHAERLWEEDFETEYVRGSVIKPITISWRDRDTNIDRNTNTDREQEPEWET
jgi:hypothetical protein